MPGLENLFAFGTVSKEFKVGDSTVRMSALDTQTLQDALNSSFGVDDMAKLVDYKKQVLARAITHANGEKYINNPKSPTAEEIKVLINFLNQFHISIINKLYDFYDELDASVKKSLSAEIKK